jgi:CheY-like chemotaxis protein
MARILIVDDEANTREMLQAAMSSIGHIGIGVPDGFMALAEVENDPPDLILLDIMMPGIDGYETLRRIRELPGGKDIPVIVVTASQASDLGKRIAIAKGNACLKKPLNLITLEQAIDWFVPKPSAAE